MKKDFKTESTISALLGTIILAISGFLVLFQYLIISLIVGIFGIAYFILAIYFHFAKPKPPEPRITIIDIDKWPLTEEKRKLGRNSISWLSIILTVELLKKIGRTMGT